MKSGRSKLIADKSEVLASRKEGNCAIDVTDPTGKAWNLFPQIGIAMQDM